MEVGDLQSGRRSANIPPKVADFVSDWSEHGLADFQEMLTLYLPPSMLHTYLTISANFHCLLMDCGTSSKKCCHWAIADGVCRKNAKQGQRFCKTHG